MIEIEREETENKNKFCASKFISVIVTELSKEFLKLYKKKVFLKFVLIILRHETKFHQKQKTSFQFVQLCAI